jgi:hypothetical protein
MKLTDPPSKAFEAQSSANATGGRDSHSGRFLDGNKLGSSGRKKGARARWNEQFLADIEEAWLDMGPSAIRRALLSEPAGTIRALIAILPKHSKLEVTSNLGDIPDDVLDVMLQQAEERVARSKAIEGEMRNVTPPAPPVAVPSEPAPAPALPYPVGRAVPLTDREMQRRNIRKLHEDGDVDPSSLF